MHRDRWDDGYAGAADRAGAEAEPGGTLVHRERAHALAVYGERDSRVARVVVAWP